MVTRRHLLYGAGALALSAIPVMRLARAAARADRPKLASALQAAAWIHRSRIETRHGVTWPADPRETQFDPQSAETQTLYSHGPGVVLFLLELYRATGDREVLAEAQRGADHLSAILPAYEESGPAALYIGMSGIAYVLELAHRASGEGKYRVAAIQYMNAIRRRAKINSDTATWEDYNDIIAGSAGTGLTLLWWARAMKDTDAGSLAKQAGRGLIERAEKTESGHMQWRPGASMKTIYPNFSHGTAGIAYFLTRLYRVTGERDFLDAAVSGARHLLSIADTHDESCKIYHHTNADGSPADMYYWSWCHGPVGSWRLFYELATATRDKEWAQWVRRCAHAVLTSGIPEQRLTGFWNNVSLCCGNSGVAQGFLDLHRAYRTPDYLTFSERVAADMMQRGTLDEQGLRWVQAEHRVQPENVVAQTGLMQGAAGMATLLLHLDGRQRGRAPFVVLPDSPFGA